VKFIELFAGIGGFRLGLERAGHQCVWANEILEKPRSIYEYNFKEKPDGRDIRTIQPDEIPESDLLCGGFPCATFSVAGKRTGFSTEDTRGSLFFEICRILRGKHIPYVFLENVKGLLNHDSGRTFSIILSSLDELGYDAQWECINSKNFGVPQHRERVFIVGNLRGKPRPKVFPLGRCFGKEADKGAETQRQGQRIHSACLPTLDAHYYKGGSTRAVIAEAGKIGRESNESIHTLQNSKLRKLTPLECERLQSLPDNWTKWYADGSLVSDKERYERCGRSVTINVIEAIGKKL
jgi:DNA (cytosine-5)-methyltransferase 1